MAPARSATRMPLLQPGEGFANLGELVDMCDPASGGRFDLALAKLDDCISPVNG